MGGNWKGSALVKRLARLRGDDVGFGEGRASRDSVVVDPVGDGASARCREGS